MKSDVGLGLIILILVSFIYSTIDMIDANELKMVSYRTEAKLRAYKLESERVALEVEKQRLRAAEIGFAHKLINKEGYVYELID